LGEETASEETLMVHGHAHHCRTWRHIHLPLHLWRLNTSHLGLTDRSWRWLSRTFSVSSKFAAMF